MESRDGVGRNDARGHLNHRSIRHLNDMGRPCRRRPKPISRLLYLLLRPKTGHAGNLLLDRAPAVLLTTSIRRRDRCLDRSLPNRQRPRRGCRRSRPPPSHTSTPSALLRPLRPSTRLTLRPSSDLTTYLICRRQTAPPCPNALSCHPPPRLDLDLKQLDQETLCRLLPRMPSDLLVEQVVGVETRSSVRAARCPVTSGLPVGPARTPVKGSRVPRRPSEDCPPISDERDRLLRTRWAEDLHPWLKVSPTSRHWSPNPEGEEEHPPRLGQLSDTPFRTLPLPPQRHSRSPFSSSFLLHNHLSSRPLHLLRPLTNSLRSRSPPLCYPSPLPWSLSHSLYPLQPNTSSIRPRRAFFQHLRCPTRLPTKRCPTSAARGTPSPVGRPRGTRFTRSRRSRTPFLPSGRRAVGE